MRVAILSSKIGALQSEGAPLNPNKPPPLGKTQPIEMREPLV